MTQLFPYQMQGQVESLLQLLHDEPTLRVENTTSVQSALVF